MKHVAKNIDFIVGYNCKGLYNPQKIMVRFKDGDTRYYKDFPKYTDNYFDNHFVIEQTRKNKKIEIYARRYFPWSNDFCSVNDFENYVERISNTDFIF